MKFLFVFLVLFSRLFGAVFTPKTLDSKGIQDSIHEASSKGGGTVKLKGLTYTITNSLYLKDNVNLEGEAKTVLKKNDGVVGEITKDAKTGDLRLYVTNPTKFSKNDGISVYSLEIIRGSVFVSEVVESKSDSIIIKDPLPFALKVSSNPRIQNTFPLIYIKKCKNATVQMLTIDGNASKNQVIDSWWDSGIGIRDSKKIFVKKINVSFISGDGVSLNSSDDITIEDVAIQAPMRMGIHIGSGSLRTILRNTKIYNSGLYNNNVKDFKDGIFLCFGAKYGLYENNIVKDCKGAGISIGYQDSDNNFYNNTINKNTTGVFFRTDTSKCNNLYFVMNNISDNFLYDLHTAQPVNDLYIDNWPIKVKLHPACFNLFCLDQATQKWIPYVWKK